MTDDHDAVGTASASTPPPAAPARPVDRRPTATGTVVVIVLVAVALLVGAGAVGVAIARPSAPQHPATISVAGSGTVQGAPDTVSFQVGVHTQQPSAITALASNNQRIKGIETVLMQHHVLAKEMRTSGLNIYEVTNQNGQLTGFAVDDTLDVTMHTIKHVGAVLEAAALEAGPGVNLSGITFSITNESTLLAAARSRAIQDAHAAASEIAAGANDTVGNVVKVTDQEQSAPPIYYSPYAFKGLELNATASGVPIQAGRQPVRVEVSVIYALSS